MLSPYTLQDMSVVLRLTDEYLGEVIQTFSLHNCGSTSFKVYDQHGKARMMIKGQMPNAFSLCCGNQAVQISVSDLLTDRQELHKDLFKPENELRPDRGAFEIHFFEGLDNKMKALLLGFAFNIVSNFGAKGESGDLRTVRP